MLESAVQHLASLEREPAIGYQQRVTVFPSRASYDVTILNHGRVGKFRTWSCSVSSGGRAVTGLIRQTLRHGKWDGTTLEVLESLS